MTLSSQEDLTAFAIACPSVDHCIVGGGDNDQPGAHLMFTLDAGQTWEDVVNIPATVEEEVDSLSCTPSATCWAVGEGAGPLTSTQVPISKLLTESVEDSGMAVSQDGGETWTAVATPPSWHKLKAQARIVACAAETCLVAAGEEIFVTPADKPDFQRRATPRGATGIEDLTCAPAGMCLTAYHIGPTASLKEGLAMSVNFGRSWTNLASTPPGGTGISCPDAQHCAMASDRFWTTSDGGLSWSAAPIPGADNFYDTSCPALGRCAVVGYAGIGAKVWFEGGGPLPPKQVQPPPPWAPVALPPGAKNFAIASCWAAQDCVATTNNTTVILRTTNAGRDWQRAPGQPPDASYGISAVSCSATNTCLAVIGGGGGGQGELAASGDAGVHWSAVALPDGWQAAGVSPMSVSCAGPWCVVAGDNQATSTDPVALVAGTSNGGRTWVTLASPPDATQAISISCSPEGTCLFVYGAGEVIVNAVAFSNDGGRHWVLRSSSVDDWGQVTSVSCPSSSTCFTTGNFILKTEDSGTSWAEVPPPAATRTGLAYLTVNEVTCPTTDSCWLLGNKGTKAVAWRQLANP